MSTPYIIVQAGGKGTRLAHLTANKPKCLVPIHNLPMLFHLFKKYPKSNYIIIGDYQYDVLAEYLHAFAEVSYLLVKATGKEGTLAGIRDALAYIPSNTAFTLIWSDLILSETLEIPAQGQYIGLSKDFPCRWKYEAGKLEEQASYEHGVAGLFTFAHKDVLASIPAEGEFVRWLQSQHMQFEELPMYQSKEYGVLSEYEKLAPQKCRPFNRLTITETTIRKEPITKQGQDIAKKELAWYRYVTAHSTFAKIPKIIQYEPFEMQKINGHNVYESGHLDLATKKTILSQLVTSLQELHAIGHVDVDYFSVKEAYFSKTIDRLNQIRDLVPYANERYIVINGRRCRNIFFNKQALEEKIMQLSIPQFVFLHGDCTFSNTLLDEAHQPIFIDPRGYFGRTLLFGDADYDWAKLYYSIVGNYDQFNLKRFRLQLMQDASVTVEVESNGWEALEAYFFELLGETVDAQKIKLLHAIIWLSLTTYAWEDYDAICGAFYLGLYYLEEVL